MIVVEEDYLHIVWLNSCRYLHGSATDALGKKKIGCMSRFFLFFSHSPNVVCTSFVFSKYLYVG